jgi:hypothetical protein
MMHTSRLFRNFALGSPSRRDVLSMAALVCGLLALTHPGEVCGESSVLAWGANGSGQTNVPGGLTNVVMVAAGAFHNMALRSDGTSRGQKHLF